MLRKTLLSIATLFCFCTTAYAQPTFLNYNHLKPVTGIFSACWKLWVNEPKVDCNKLASALFRTIVNTDKVSPRDIEYGVKYLENIMFSEWYDEAVKKGLPWNQFFADAENLSNACVEKHRNVYLTIDCMNAQIRPNLKAAWAFLSGKFNQPTAQESPEVNRYFVQSMLSCLRENASKQNTEDTQLDCLIHVEKTVDKLSFERTYQLLLISYTASYNWLSTNQVYVPFDIPDNTSQRCLKITEDNAKLNCILDNASKIASYGQTISKSISKPFEAAF